MDKTGLTGSYDFTLDYTIYSPPPGPEGPPSAPAPPELAAALREQFGLQLVRTKGPLDVVVVESVDKLPTEN